MVGKTFKGLTDELLRWQTEALLARAIERHGIAVMVRPELVVEIALDGVQSSTRYPGGIALRFARVKRYRPDKDAGEAGQQFAAWPARSSGLRRNRAPAIRTSSRLAVPGHDGEGYRTRSTSSALQVNSARTATGVRRPTPSPPELS